MQFDERRHLGISRAAKSLLPNFSREELSCGRWASKCPAEYLRIRMQKTP
jgi:hypothetical protein